MNKTMMRDDGLVYIRLTSTCFSGGMEICLFVSKEHSTSTAGTDGEPDGNCYDTHFIFVAVIFFFSTLIDKKGK